MNGHNDVPPGFFTAFRMTVNSADHRLE